MLTGTTIILILGAFLVGIVILLGIRKASGLRARSADDSPLDRLEPLLPDAHLGKNEEQASPISEQIEEMARKRIAEYPDLAEYVIDFGTALDGSLEIWIADKRYTNVDDIPDARVREAISEAVKEFNI
ncbi:MAG: hypothetical protein V3V46_09760 [Anaerolineales bacterium]|jgi:Na+-transporting NADH:ubiquinone oxidoreductase subunit NqrC